MDKDFLECLLEKLDEFAAFHSLVNHIDLSIKKLYPIAVAAGNTFYVFDVDEPYCKYQFIMDHCMHDLQMPDEVRACFPLGFYENKPAAVVSESALDTKEGQVLIIHEFVHCYQNNDALEQEIKNSLLVYKESLVSNNYMWELNHKFPYGDSFFVGKIKELDFAYKTSNEKEIQKFYSSMKSNLRRQDYEYMLWQEWSEGFARYIENKVRTFLGMEQDIMELQEPFDRMVFYETGSRHIDIIVRQMDRPDIDIADLYYKMNET